MPSNIYSFLVGHTEYYNNVAKVLFKWYYYLLAIIAYHIEDEID